MIKYFSLLALLLLVNTNNITAQLEKPNNSIGKTFLGDMEHFFDLGIGLAKSPFSFSTNDWYTVGIVAGGTASLFIIDKNVRTFSQNNQTDINDKIFNLDRFYGSPYTGLFTASIYGYGLFTKNKKIRKLGLQATEALFYSTLITGILKVSLGRRRPNAGESHLVFQPFQFISNNTYQSLPSGHTTAAFAVSTVMANHIDNLYWKIFWYGSAGMVGLSRIYHNQHWTSDVFLGAAIGYFVGSFVINFDKENTEYFGIKVNPYFTFNTIGVTLRF